MLLSRSLVIVAVCALSITPAIASEPGDYVADGHLKQAIQLSHVQLGGFAGRLATEISIDVDNSWTATQGVGARPGEPRQGMLTDEQVNQLATALAEHDLAGLPKTIGSDKPVTSPQQIADGASTTIKLTFGEQSVTANFADGVKVDGEAQALRRRLAAIESTMQAVTLNAKPAARNQ